MNGRVPPSPRRLREARARGEVAHAPLLSAAAALAGAAVATALMARPAAARLMALGRAAWGGELDGAAALERVLPTVAAVALPIAMAAAAAALAAGLAQTRFLFAWGAFARRRDEDEGLAATTWAAALATALVLLAAGRALVAALARADATATVLAATVDALEGAVPRAILVVALAGLGDFAWRRARLLDALSMTRAEAERERREDEGDPRLRAEQRRRQRALGRDPLVDEVARAQLVVTAEGVAVALRLDDVGARVTAAAGERLRAQRIADVARRLGLRVRPDEELAAALADAVPGAPVPPAWQARAQTALRAVRR